MTSHEPLIVINVPSDTTPAIAQQIYDQTRARLPDRDILVVAGDIRISETWPDICGDVLDGPGQAEICRRSPHTDGGHVARPWDPDSPWWTDRAAWRTEQDTAPADTDQTEWIQPPAQQQPAPWSQG
jgi:hypothetical protein